MSLGESVRELAGRVVGNARRLAAAREYDGEVTDALRATEAREHGGVATGRHVARNDAEEGDRAAGLVADLTALAERHGLTLAGPDLAPTALEAVRSGQLAVLSGEEWESLEETLDVLADPGAVAAIEEGPCPSRTSSKTFAVAATPPSPRPDPCAQAARAVPTPAVPT